MQRRWKELAFFDILAPVLIHYTISYLVSLTAIIILFIRSEAAGLVADGFDQAEMMQAVSRLYENNGLIFSGVVATITIPIFWNMLKKEKIIQKSVHHTGRYLLLIPLGIAAAVTLNQMIGFLHLEQLFHGYAKTREVLFRESIWLSVLVLGFLVPVAEELLFRGLVYERIERRSGYLYAAIGSSLLFGAYHLNVIQFLYAFCFGLLLTFVYKNYRTIVAPVIVHAAANIFIYFASGITWMEKSPFTVLSCLGGAILSAGILITIRMKSRDLHL